MGKKAKAARKLSSCSTTTTSSASPSALGGRRKHKSVAGREEVVMVAASKKQETTVKMNSLSHHVQEDASPAKTPRQLEKSRREDDRPSSHPYLSGNYAPIHTEIAVPTTCTVVQGAIPSELAGGQYVRNGGNPSNPGFENGTRDAHWFDGDGMLAGVLFERQSTRAQDGKGQQGEEVVVPKFVNRFIATDLYRMTPSFARTPVLPSISTLVSPSTSLWTLFVQVMRAFFLYALTWLPGLGLDEDEKAKRLSVANASVWYHDGKVLTGCESGPPMQVLLPRLETVGWFTGASADGHKAKKSRGWAKGWNALQRHFMEYTTAHPKVDPMTGEMVLFHMSLVKPYLRISVIPPSSSQKSNHQKLLSEQDEKSTNDEAVTQSISVLGAKVSGFRIPKLMHDFACTATQTIIIDHPLTLDPMNLLRGRPILDYDPKVPVRFAVFPRRNPEKARWIDAKESFIVFHTANAWDDDKAQEEGKINLLACRLNSATLVYTAGNLAPPTKALPQREGEQEKCQLHYWRFSTGEAGEIEESGPSIEMEFPLSAIPFEFPTLRDGTLMKDSEFVYGTSTRNGSFDAKLNLAAKIDCIVKVNVSRLISQGRKAYEAGLLQEGECVDSRTVEQILHEQQLRQVQDREVEDNISIFPMPTGWYAQEASFVARSNATTEDDGYLLFYAFNEQTGLDPLTGSVWPHAKSELWIIDARNMRDVVARIELPQRVPYGLHGNFFTEHQIASQDPSLLAAEGMLRSDWAKRPHPMARKLSTDPLGSDVGKMNAVQRRWSSWMWALKDSLEAKIA